ncbi:hypothetical protein Clacol_008187 [Clathrus columnatus]|uniref:Uncharacterized protein n=1 Tax=Clathrus columnatus TaxID=1419009 RepID=A0AAV5APV2_9AGAM|nr:hypothetical protein Clacol_008187 [Clathrus columnatus]
MSFAKDDSERLLGPRTTLPQTIVYVNQSVMIVCRNQRTLQVAITKSGWVIMIMLASFSYHESESVKQSPSGHLTSLYSGPPNGGHVVSKMDERALEINETRSPPPSRLRRPSCNNLNNHLSITSDTDVYFRRPSSFLPACISTPSLHTAREIDGTNRFSETHLPYSFTLDSFMDFESINEPLENNNYLSNSFRSPTSSKALWKSLTTNASALISVFEPRTKRPSFDQNPPPSSPQNKGQATSNPKLKLFRSPKKSFSPLPGRLTSNQLESEPLLLSQPISQIPGKKLPALHKRVSAVFRSDSLKWNSVNEYSLRSSSFKVFEERTENEALESLVIPSRIRLILQ